MRNIRNHYEFLRGNNEFHFMMLNQTGRKNQIRVHFRDLGFPIVEMKNIMEKTKIKIRSSCVRVSI